MSENNGFNDKNKNHKLEHLAIVLFACCVVILLLIFNVDTVKKGFSWLLDVLSPIILGVAMAYMINPMCKFFNKHFSKSFLKKSKNPEKSKRHANTLSIALSVIILILLIALLLFLIIPEFFQNLKILIERIPGFVEQISDWFNKQLHADNEFINNFKTYIDKIWENVHKWMDEELNATIEKVLSFATTGVISVISFLVDFLIAFVVCVYALAEKNSFIARSKKLVCSIFSKKHANFIFKCGRYSNEVFGQFVIGKLITSSIVGIVTFIFMKICGMPYALISAVILGVTNIIPFFGPFIGGIPTALIVLISNYKQGIIYIVFMIVLQQIEGNIIEPAIMEDKTGVSKFWVTFALLLFGGMFGVLGMVISVPLFAILFYICKHFVENRLKKKEMPIDSEEYLNLYKIDEETDEFIQNPPKNEQSAFARIKVTAKKFREKFRRNKKD